MKKILLLLFAFLAITSHTTFADPIPPSLIPAGLLPGQQFRLVFVTSTSTRVDSIFSTDIADFDAFVTGAANGAGSLLVPLGLSWTVIGSTATVDAIDHIHLTPDTVPIYNLLRQLVAPNEAGLWDGSLDNAISANEFGSSLSTSVWTGTLDSGLKSAFSPLGGGGARLGSSTATNSAWINSGDNEGYLAFPLYGISPILTVPNPVPEPGTVTLLLAGLLGLGGAARRKARGKKKSYQIV